MKYTGPTRNFRSAAPNGTGDRYRWVTLKPGNTIPPHIIPILEKEEAERVKVARIKNYEKDLLDDGKRNYSVPVKDKVEVESHTDSKQSKLGESKKKTRIVPCL